MTCLRAVKKKAHQLEQFCYEKELILFKLKIYIYFY